MRRWQSRATEGSLWTPNSSAIQSLHWARSHRTWAQALAGAQNACHLLLARERRRWAPVPPSTAPRPSAAGAQIPPLMPLCVTQRSLQRLRSFFSNSYPQTGWSPPTLFTTEQGHWVSELLSRKHRGLEGSQVAQLSSQIFWGAEERVQRSARDSKKRGQQKAGGDEDVYFPRAGVSPRRTRNHLEGSLPTTWTQGKEAH